MDAIQVGLGVFITILVALIVYLSMLIIDRSTTTVDTNNESNCPECDECPVCECGKCMMDDGTFVEYNVIDSSKYPEGSSINKSTPHKHTIKKGSFFNEDVTVNLKGNVSNAPPEWNGRSLELEKGRTDGAQVYVVKDGSKVFNIPSNTYYPDSKNYAFKCNYP